MLVSHPPPRSRRDFEAVKTDLHNVVLRLKATENQRTRHRLLRQLRLLLEEADQILETEPD